MRTGERGGAQRGRFGHREQLERLVERVSEELAVAGAQAASAEETQRTGPPPPSVSKRVAGMAYRVSDTVVHGTEQVTAPVLEREAGPGAAGLGIQERRPLTGQMREEQRLDGVR